MVLLRRKLEALNYTEPLDLASAALVSHIVNDLIRTTDSYRSVKLQAAKYAQDISKFNTKVKASVLFAMTRSSAVAAASHACLRAASIHHSKALLL